MIPKTVAFINYSPTLPELRYHPTLNKKPGNETTEIPGLSLHCNRSRQKPVGHRMALKGGALLNLYLTEVMEIRRSRSDR
jgi:hypothetical protein